MNRLEQLWSSDFGDSYHKRNRVQWTKRIPFWRSIIDTTCARSVHEVGCGPGWNLSAIRRAYPDVQVSGSDVNQQALGQAAAAELFVDSDFPYPVGECADLVFTCGVLIHIATEDLQKTMQDIIDASFDWVLAVEYYAAREVEVPYRNQTGALFKRPYGELYINMGLTWVAAGQVGPADGFDDCQWDLLRKP